MTDKSDDPRGWYLKNHIKTLRKLEQDLAERILIAGGYKPPYTLDACVNRTRRAAAGRHSDLYTHLVSQFNSVGIAIAALDWCFAGSPK